MSMTNKKISFLLWLLLGALLVAINFKHPLNSDEGVILGGAWRLWNGDELYRDFLEFIPPGGFYFVWGIWKIFGPSYWISRLASLLLVFAGGVGLYKIGKDSFRIKRELWCFFPVLLFFISSPFWPLINHNAFSIVFVVWALYFYLQGLNFKKNSSFAWSGIFTGVSILFLQHRAGMLLITGMVFLAVLILRVKEWRWEHLLYYMGFSALPLLFLLKWPPSVLFDNLFVFPLLNYPDINRIPLWWFYISLLWLVVLFIAVRKQLSLPQKFLFAAFVALLISVLSRPDLPHLSLIFPILAVIVVSFRDSFSSQHFLTKVILVAEVCFLLGIGLFFLLHTSTGYNFKNSKVFSYIDENCSEEYIYVGTFLPGIYFETGKHNPTSFPALPELNQDRAKLDKIKKRLIETEPQCIIMNYSSVAKFGYNKDNPVDNFIADKYKRTFKKNGFIIFQPRH